MEFEAFPKMPRLSREMVITEKIDGTNAQVFITPVDILGAQTCNVPWIATIGGLAIAAGSRTRWLAPTGQGDNFGFAAWVQANVEELITLGPGRHFGEWWGKGIQRGYGLAEKKFSLFNVGRW